MFSKIKKVTINTEPRWTASAYTAGVITKEDVNDLILGRRKQIVVDKKEVSGRDLMELVYVDEDGAMPIPADVATDEDKKDLDEAVWYSTQAKVVEDKRASKAFLECYKALEAGKPIGGSESEDKEEVVVKKKDTKPAPKKQEKAKEPKEPMTKADQINVEAALGVSVKEFKKLNSDTQIAVVTALQNKADACSKKATEFAKLVKKASIRGAKADAKVEQLYKQLKKLVSKDQHPLVEKLRESGADPVQAAETFFDITLEEPSKPSGKDNRKGKKPKSGKKESAPVEEPKPTEAEGSEPSQQPILGAVLIAYLRKGGMSDDDIDAMKEIINVHEKYDLGEIVAIVKELGYDDDSKVMQSLRQ